MKWKDKLLSSSVPLEYEVGKLLVENEFSVHFDYAYKRFDHLEKEFSVDVKGYGFYPFERDSSIKMTIDLLVECKYRNPNVSWLFMPDINNEIHPSHTTEGVIKVIDEFSEFHAQNSGFPICETCLKGVEINIQNGDVHDQGINHGISQLVYAMPSLLYRHIRNSLTDHLEDIYPYIICPILVTTADIRLLKNEFSIEKVKNAESLDDISETVPYLKVYSNVYPTFEDHCKKIFKDIMDYRGTNERLEYFKNLRKIKFDKNGNINFKKLYSNPESLLFSLQHGIETGFFRETIVCNFVHLPLLLEEIKMGIATTGRFLKKLKSTK